MDKVLVTNILNVLQKSYDKNVILKAVLKLRTDIVKDSKGVSFFRDCGGVPVVVRLLDKPHEKILEVVLSILGNCCTDESSCIQALENKIVSPLITILKSIPNPLIQCRACRLLGNLAKGNASHLILHSSTISQSLSMIIEETSEMQTILMAIRAAKFLLIDKLFVKHFVKNKGYKLISRILIKLIKNPNPIEDANKASNEINAETESTGLKSSQHREKYFEEVARNLEGVRSDIFDSNVLKKTPKKSTENYVLPENKINIDVITEILKCIQLISECQSNAVVLELYSPGYDLTCIVFFIEKHSVFRSIALKIVSGFAKNPLAIPALCYADAINAACEILTDDNLDPPLCESEIRHCFNIICVLAEDACNRAKIRISGALKKLIERAKVSDSVAEITLILFALNHFQYDHLSMDLLLREGLVGILIKELNLYLNATDKYRKEKCEERKQMSRKRKAEEMSKHCGKNLKSWFDMLEPDSPNSIDSPVQTSSPSPCSSRGMSPVNSSFKNYKGENWESETYSPVCSGDEDDSGDGGHSKKREHNEDHDLMKLLDIPTKAESNGSENLSSEDEDVELNKIHKGSANYKLPSSNHPASGIDIIDNLLLRISLHSTNRGELGKAETLRTIIEAMSMFPFTTSTFGNTLYNILLESQFFVQIVKQDTIYRIYQLIKSEDIKCRGTNTYLEALTCVGESGYGKGEITKLLLKNEIDTQKRAAIAVSFIIRSPRLLYQLLTENNALYILLNTILHKGDEFGIEAAEGLTFLSQCLGIEIPKYDSSEFNEDDEFDELMSFPLMNRDSNEDEMKFILHRGCSRIPIKFNKRLLAESSEVFKSMLYSDFKECREGEIHLKNYTVHGIKYFLNLVDLTSKRKLLNIPPIYYFDSLLEAYELSKMYMMNNLAKKLYNMILFRICKRTCLRIFEWSLKNCNEEMSQITINYYLSSDLCGRKKVKLFQEADYSKYSKEWNQMIIDAVLVKCQNSLMDYC